MKLWFVNLLSVFLLIGCGAKRANITSPAQGQTFVLGSFNVIDVVLDVNDYRGFSIEFQSSVPAQFLQCQNTTDQQARCFSSFFPGQNFDFTLQQACLNPACPVTIVVRNGDHISDVRTIFISQQNPNQQFGQGGQPTQSQQPF